MEPFIEHKNKIKDLITKRTLRDGFTELAALLANKDPFYMKTYYSLESRDNKLEVRKMKNTISDSDYRIEKSKLIDGTINFIDEIPIEATIYGAKAQTKEIIKNVNKDLEDIILEMGPIKNSMKRITATRRKQKMKRVIGGLFWGAILALAGYYNEEIVDCIDIIIEDDDKKENSYLYQPRINDTTLAILDDMEIINHYFQLTNFDQMK